MLGKEDYYPAVVWCHLHGKEYLKGNRNFKIYVHSWMDQISDISDIKENDATFCHSVLFIFISSAVQRGEPTIVVNIYFRLIIVSTLPGTVCGIITCIICNIFGKKCSEKNLLKGLHFISIWHNVSITRVVERNTLMLWGMQHQHLNILLNIYLLSFWELANMWQNWDTNIAGRWNRADKMWMLIAEPGEATGKAWWGREGQGASRGVAFGIFLSSTLCFAVISRNSISNSFLFWTSVLFDLPSPPSSSSTSSKSSPPPLWNNSQIKIFCLFLQNKYFCKKNNSYN